MDLNGSEMLDDDLPDPQYALLVEVEVQSVVLDVYELHGGKWKPVYDHDGHLEQMLPSEAMCGLSSRVTQPGLYRDRSPRLVRTDRDSRSLDTLGG